MNDMSTISEKLVRLEEYKQDIKEAINDKGVSVQDNMSTYADAIRNIKAGGGYNIQVKPKYVTKLSNYPDLSNLQTDDHCVYFVYDNRTRDQLTWMNC